MKTNLFHICFLVICLVILCMVIKPSRIENFLPKVENFLPKVENFLPKVENFLPKVENFLPGVFGFAPRVGGCTPENNCYPGSYAATQKYHNMCQPSFGLNRQKIGLQDHCTHDLGKMSNELYLTQNSLIPKNAPKNTGKRIMQPVNISPDKNMLVCTVDNHLQRRCQWVKPSEAGFSKLGTQSVPPPF